MPNEIREIAGFFYREGVVDRKTYNLAALAAMVAVRCDHCIPRRMSEAVAANLIGRFSMCWPASAS